MKKLVVGAVAFVFVLCLLGCETEPPGGYEGDLDITVRRQGAKVEALETKVAALEAQVDTLEASLIGVTEAYNTLAKKFEDHMSKYHQEKATVPRAKPPKKRVK